jgi:hypothetical protein
MARVRGKFLCKVAKLSLAPSRVANMHQDVI